MLQLKQLSLFFFISSYQMFAFRRLAVILVTAEGGFTLALIGWINWIDLVCLKKYDLVSIRHSLGF